MQPHLTFTPCPDEEHPFRFDVTMTGEHCPIAVAEVNSFNGTVTLFAPDGSSAADRTVEGVDSPERAEDVIQAFLAEVYPSE